MTVQDLPHVNASLNALSAVLLVTGYACVRHKKITAHKSCMFGAVAVTGSFLTCYLIYHFQVGSVGFSGRGMIRPIYFTILISHTVLAASLAVLVPITLVRALKGRIDPHRRIARWTLPLWIYVSITGIVVYGMLYHWVPPFGR
ncbi:MAG: DUF420 domain-containing protein [Phycisphaerae bacterium]